MQQQYSDGCFYQSTLDVVCGCGWALLVVVCVHILYRFLLLLLDFLFCVCILFTPIICCRVLLSIACIQYDWQNCGWLTNQHLFPLCGKVKVMRKYGWVLLVLAILCVCVCASCYAALQNATINAPTRKGNVNCKLHSISSTRQGKQLSAPQSCTLLFDPRIQSMTFQNWNTTNYCKLWGINFQDSQQIYNPALGGGVHSISSTSQQLSSPHRVVHLFLFKDPSATQKTCEMMACSGWMMKKNSKTGHIMLSL